MSGDGDPWPVAVAALQIGTRVVDEIQAAARTAGFHDVTALHGFAFARIAGADATTADLAEHLGVSKQAAAQLAERLVRAGYVRRAAHPRDRRARLLELTPRGRDCMRVARLAAGRAVRSWRDELPAGDVRPFEASLLRLTSSIPSLRPPL